MLPSVTKWLKESPAGNHTNTDGRHTPSFFNCKTKAIFTVCPETGRNKKGWQESRPDCTRKGLTCSRCWVRCGCCAPGPGTPVLPLLPPAPEPWLPLDADTRGRESTPQGAGALLQGLVLLLPDPEAEVGREGGRD